MKRVHAHLPDPMIAKLRALAKRTGLKLAELIRRACDEYLARQK